jgi:alanine racemase
MARAWADVSLSAVGANVATLRELAAPARLCAVVKAGGYGHGAVPVARAAVEAGADWLAVAQVPEVVELRAGGLTVPILLLSEPRPDEVPAAVEAGAVLTVYTESCIAAVGQEADRQGVAPVPVHLKVDTGMRRVGAPVPAVLELAERVVAHRSLDLGGVWTHCAVADEPANPFTVQQLERFDGVLSELAAAGIEVPIRHAANSAGAIAHPSSRYDMVRCGISIYGIPPAPALRGLVTLDPALRLSTEVSLVKEVAAGDGISYGLRHHVPRATRVATLPVGYADGVHRALGLGGQEVLIGGRRHQMVGVVTMDQVMVDVGPDSTVAAGEEVVLLGAQGTERITPEEWAAQLSTIAYEVVCSIGPRVERRHQAPE